MSYKLCPPNSDVPVKFASKVGCAHLLDVGWTEYIEPPKPKKVVVEEEVEENEEVTDGNF